jgi:hypothetical protein
LVDKLSDLSLLEYLAGEGTVLAALRDKVVQHYPDAYKVGEHCEEDQTFKVEFVVLAYLAGFPQVEVDDWVVFILYLFLGERFEFFHDEI